MHKSKVKSRLPLSEIQNVLDNPAIYMLYCMQELRLRAALQFTEINKEKRGTHMKQNLLTRLTAALSAAVTGLAAFSACSNDTVRDRSTQEVVREMGFGINLGNTFESCGDWIGKDSVTNYETGWGSPVVTEEMIRGYADSGFGALRVPVAWSNMMQENYTIHPDYLARVQEVVGWAMDAGLYVILNIHWDGGWWTDFAVADKKDECMKKYTRIWEQLCDAFGTRGDHLIFESLNEEGCWDSLWNRWGGKDGKEEAFGLLNEINQTFVDLVRKSGGNNAKRHLLIAGYATDVELTCDAAFKMPEDPAKHCAVSVHYYTPVTFCILEEDADWGKARSTWGTEKDQRELTKYMDMLKTTFVDKGVPVIIGEYGCPTKNKDPESVKLFLTSVAKEAYAREMCPVLWATTGNFYDRENAKMYDDALKQSFAEIVQQPAAA